ncbi:MAG TPA: pilus assembly protein PilM [Chitinivibrionales bacterium]
MASRKDNSCGIEVQKGLITVAHYSAAENAVGSIVVNPFDEGEGRDGEASLREELSKITAAVDFKRRGIAVSLPAQYAIIKKLALDADERDPAGAILWELSQNIIGAIDDYSVDFEPLARQASQSMRYYLTVAYRTAYIEKLVGLLKAHKLSPHVIDLDIFALVNVFESNYSECTASPALLLLGTDDKTDIVLTQGGTLLDYDVCRYGQSAIAPDDYATLLSDYCGRLFGAWGIQTPPLYCSGPLFSHQEYLESTAGKFGTAQLLDPFRKITCRAANGENDMRALSPQLAVAVGLALRGQDGQ